MSKCENCCYGVMTGPNKMFCSAQNCFCEEVFDCEDYEPIAKPQTNADRIRKWSDEEIAEFTIGVADGVFELFTGAKMPNEKRRVMKAEWLDWLKQGISNE